MHRLAPFFLLLSVLASAHAASPPDFPTDDSAAAALDAPDFILREKAARHLWRRGTAALPLLEKLAGGEAESALRARAIIENIRLGITTETPAELAGFILKIHQMGDPDARYALLSDTVSQPRGLRLLVDFIEHETKQKKPEWESLVTETASHVAFGHEEKTKSPIYRELLASVQGDVLPSLFRHAFDSGDAGFAYDMLSFSPLPDPSYQDRARKVMGAHTDFVFLPHYRDPDAPIYYPRSPEGWIAEAEKLAGDPARLLLMLEKLLAGSDPSDADALTASLYEQNLLPKWIEDYRRKVEEGAPDSNRMALAQFLRASDRHQEAWHIAKGHTRNSTEAITFALLAQDWDGALQIEDTPATRQLVDRIESSDKFQTFLNLGTPADILLGSRRYWELTNSAKKVGNPLERIGLSTQIAPFSPGLAREIIREISPESLEKTHGAMGQLLAAKRLTGDHLPLIRYMSARFATITSEFWDTFMEKYFGSASPLWIADFVRTREAEFSRAKVMRIALTEGASALVPEDLADIFGEFLGATNEFDKIPPHALVIAKRIQTLLREERFAGELQKIMAWAGGLRRNDPRATLLLPQGPPEPNHFSNRKDDPAFYQKLARTSLVPPTEALLRIARAYLREGTHGKAVPWLAVAVWSTERSGTDSDFQGGSPFFLAAHQSLESALGLQALENSDLPTALKRFQNLCTMGSLDHQLGTAIYQKLVSSDRKTEAHALFAARWDQLESILNIAPRDSDVCRALATWAIACDQLPTEAEAYAELAETLESEQAQLKAHLTRFDW